MEGKDDLDEDVAILSPGFAEAVEALDTIGRCLITSEIGKSIMNNFIQIENRVLKKQVRIYQYLIYYCE